LTVRYRDVAVVSLIGGAGAANRRRTWSQLSLDPRSLDAQGSPNWAPLGFETRAGAKSARQPLLWVLFGGFLLRPGPVH
jgi:hypothetical protein